MTFLEIILLIVLAWFTAIGLILPVNAFLAAGRDRGDRTADAELARRAAAVPATKKKKQKKQPVLTAS